MSFRENKFETVRDLYGVLVYADKLENVSTTTPTSWYHKYIVTELLNIL